MAYINLFVFRGEGVFKDRMQKKAPIAIQKQAESNKKV
jgi:hypothetical protein